MNRLRFPMVPAALAVSLTLVAGCATSRLPDPAGATPYTAAQIRDANPPGTTIVFRIEQADMPSVMQTLSFLPGDDVSVVESTMHGPDGQPFRSPTRTEAPWTELRDHALFPAESTRVTESTCDGPDGPIACWLYTVEAEHAGAPAVRRFHFAPSKPGPPVRYEIEQDGAIVFTMAMIEDSRD